MLFSLLLINMYLSS